MEVFLNNNELGIEPSDPVALDLLDQALQNPVGRPLENRVNHPILSEESEPKNQDRSGKLIRRLRQDFPELHAQVLSRELSIHRAAVQAGIFPKRYVVNLGSPKMNDDDLAKQIQASLDRDAIRDAILELAASLLPNENYDPSDNPNIEAATLKLADLLGNVSNRDAALGIQQALMLMTTERL
jgi:hypothetical protein